MDIAHVTLVYPVRVHARRKLDFALDARRVAVPTFGSSEAPVVIRVVRPDLAEDRALGEFRSIGGRLFRPHLSSRGNVKRPAGQILARLGMEWSSWSARLPITPHNGGFFRDDMVDDYPDLAEVSRSRSTEANRADERSVAQGLERVEAAAARLAMIDGVLHHETRTPCWSFGYGANEPPNPVVPDLDNFIDPPLFDPRHGLAQVMEALEPFVGRRPAPRASIEVFDPTALPHTVPFDAASCVARLATVELADASVLGADRAILRAYLGLDDAARASIVAFGSDVPDDLDRAVRPLREATAALAALAPDGRARVGDARAWPKAAMGAQDQALVDRVLESLELRLSDDFEADMAGVAAAFR